MTSACVFESLFTWGAFAAGGRPGRFEAAPAPGVLGHPDDHHIEFVIGGIAAGRQSLLQGKLVRIDLFNFLFEDVFKLRRSPGV
jgi:hypothetical protein